VAQLKEQGIDLIVIPLEVSFGQKTPPDQQGIIFDLQAHALSAGLRGTVVPVWDAGMGRMGFVAPPSWQPFFNSISPEWVWSNINRELFW
jgi:hypothetical protein